MWRSIPGLIKSSINYTDTIRQSSGIKMSNLITTQIYEKHFFRRSFLDKKKA
jgi:hypothetical protein